MLFVSLPTQAQSKLKFGIKGGLNITQPSLSTDAIKEDNQTGFFAGVMAEYTIPILGLGVDGAILYNNKSLKIGNVYETAKLDAQGGSTDGLESSFKETIQYIDVPINLKYTIGLGSNLGVFATTGPQFSFNIGGMNVFKNSYALKKSEFSWNVGAGVKLLKHIQVAYNYNIALGKTADVREAGALKTVTDAGTDYITGKLKNNTHQISVAFIF